MAAYRPGLRRTARRRPREGSTSMTPSTTPPPLRVGNMSGFYGDRISAMREMLERGELDVLTGDYLAELTMLILGRDRMKSAELGYAKSCLRQLDRKSVE